MAKLKQQQIRLPASGKRAVRTQFGALCYRMRNGKIQVLIITTRSGKSWIVPKGWPMDRATPAQAAAREAYEEAGVDGEICGSCLGIYSYTKAKGPGAAGGDGLPCVVALFALRVEKVHKTYPEHGQRLRKWLGRKKAAALVDNAELGELIRGFDPCIKVPQTLNSQ